MNSDNNPPPTFDYCVSVDGSKHSDLAIELVLSEFYRKGDKLNVVHIKNKSYERLSPYEYEVHKVLDQYISSNGKSIAKKDYRSFCFDRSLDNKHSLKQSLLVALQENSDIFFIGFKGTYRSELTERNFPEDVACLSKTDKNIISNNNTLSSGALYLLQLNHLPLTTIIVKEASKRKNKAKGRDKGGFIWCFCIKDMNSSFELFKMVFEKYVNKKLDRVRGVHIKTASGRYDEELEKNFINHCKDNGLKKCSFYYADQNPDYADCIGLQISEMVNFGEEYIDFVICTYNNHSYYYIENHPLYDLIMNVESNLLLSQGKLN